MQAGGLRDRCAQPGSSERQQANARKGSGAEQTQDLGAEELAADEGLSGPIQEGGAGCEAQVAPRLDRKTDEFSAKRNGNDARSEVLASGVRPVRARCLARVQ